MKKSAALVCALVVLGACANHPKDFRSAAKKALTSKSATTELHQRMEDVDCEVPGSTAVGTTFTCTATGASDGQRYEFTATIDEKKHVVVADQRAAP